MEIIKKIESFILKFEEAIMISVGLLLPIIITVGVIFRYVLKIDLYAIEEFEVFLAIWFYFMGSAYSSYKKSQITADILQVMTKNFALRKFFAIVATGLTLAISLAIAYFCTDMISYAIEKKPETAVWKIPLVAEYIAVYAGLILMTVYAARDFVEACKRHPDTEVQVNTQGGEI
ncbi:MAG: TRAP transporter small permease subunit [Synergistaceae bacterium]